MALIQLHHYYPIKNSHQNILDLILSNRSDLNVLKNKFFIVNIDLAHPPLEINGPTINNKKIPLNTKIMFLISLVVTIMR